MRTCALLLCALPLCAADYYVAPNGNDANLGTFAEPWALTKICRTTPGGASTAAQL